MRQTAGPRIAVPILLVLASAVLSRGQSTDLVKMPPTNAYEFLTLLLREYGPMAVLVVGILWLLKYVLVSRDRDLNTMVKLVRDNNVALTELRGTITGLRKSIEVLRQALEFHSPGTRDILHEIDRAAAAGEPGGEGKGD